MYVWGFQFYGDFVAIKPIPYTHQFYGDFVAIKPIRFAHQFYGGDFVAIYTVCAGTFEISSSLSGHFVLVCLNSKHAPVESLY